MNYLDVLQYLVTHPIESVIIVLAQFFIVMKLHYKYHNKWLHYALGAWFLPQDVVVNVIVFTIIGLELPREYTVTARLKRWKQLPNDNPVGWWRNGLAWKFCWLINKAEMGHC